MKLDGIPNQEVIKYLLECYERENSIRIKWNIKHKETTHKAAQFKKEPSNFSIVDTIQSPLEMQIADLTKEFQISARYRRVKSTTDKERIQGIKYLRKEHSIVSTGIGDPKDDPRLARPDTDLSPDPIMYPVEPKVSKILYQHPAPRRKLYLKKRLELQPDKKYYFPPTTYMEYGWRQDDCHLIQHQRSLQHKYLPEPT